MNWIASKQIWDNNCAPSSMDLVFYLVTCQDIGIGQPTLFQTRRYVPEKLHMVNIYSLTLLLFPAALSILSSIVQFQLQNCVYIVENVIINLHLISTNNFWWKNNICDDIKYWLNIKKIKCSDIEDQAFLFITHLVQCFSSPVVFLGYLSLSQL